MNALHVCETENPKRIEAEHLWILLCRVLVKSEEKKCCGLHAEQTWPFKSVEQNPIPPKMRFVFSLGLVPSSVAIIGHRSDPELFISVAGIMLGIDKYDRSDKEQYVFACCSFHSQNHGRYRGFSPFINCLLPVCC